MAGKHPKHRKIPTAFKKLENKVIFGVHVFELIVILFAAAVTVSVALFVKTNVSENMVEKSVNPVETVEEATKNINNNNADNKTEKADEEKETTKLGHAK